MELLEMVNRELEISELEIVNCELKRVNGEW